MQLENWKEPPFFPAHVFIILKKILSVLLFDLRCLPLLCLCRLLFVCLRLFVYSGRASPSNFHYVNQQTDDESEPLLSDTSDINLQRHGYSGEHDH